MRPHYSRGAPSQYRGSIYPSAGIATYCCFSTLQAASDDIVAVDDSQGIRADHDALQQGAARTAAVLSPLRTHSRRPGRARSSQSLPGRSQASDRSNPTDDMVIA